MPRRTRLTVVSPVNPLRAYSGLKYLCDALSARGLDLTLWADIPHGQLPEAAGWSFPVHGLTRPWARRIPKLRALPARLRVLALGLADAAPMMFVDLSYVPELGVIKRLRPHKRFVHYCPELYTPGEVTSGHRWLLRAYAHNARLPDLVIDVEPGRAELRQSWYGLARRPLTILNTLPRAEMPPPAGPGALAALAGGPLSADRPILLYTGSAAKDRNWDLLLEALAVMPRRPFFLAFCYAGQYEGDQVGALRRHFTATLGAESVRICDAVPRRELLRCIHEADAGLVYYPPSRSPGHRYAAPSKLFEYIAAGLPVVTANNPNLVELVERRGLGIAVEDESSAALAAALDRLLFDPERLAEIRRRQRTAFETDLCYEVAAAPAVDAVVQLVEGEAHA